MRLLVHPTSRSRARAKLCAVLAGALGFAASTGRLAAASVPAASAPVAAVAAPTNPAVAPAPTPAPAPSAPAPPAQAAGFSFEDVVAEARALAAAPYASHLGDVAPFFQNLTYSQNQDIRFDKNRALWHDLGLPFEIEFFHPGSILSKTVEIAEVVNGQAQIVPFRRDNFTYGPLAQPPAGTPSPGGYAGFRVHANLNQPGYKDEFLVFLGASYFRAVAKDEVYGLSARGLAFASLGTAEEFPAFEKFWLVRPAAGATALTIYALLNSPSAAGAYQFDVTPGVETLVDVTATLFFRGAASRVGVAPLSSMFWFGENSATRPEDWRPMVHDSDGLLLASADGPWQWRPLENPAQSREDTFGPGEFTGFGLLQRNHEFVNYLDLEARYDKRPGAWIELLGEWGSGTVHLLELASPKEYNDNIVAFWQPAAAPPPGAPVTWKYRLHWGAAAPEPPALSRVTSTRRGQALATDDYLFVIEFDRPPGAGPPDPVPEVEASGGAGAVVREARAQPNPQTGGWRVTLRVRFKPDAHRTELQCQLFRQGKPLSEQWNYLWTTP